LANLLLAHQDLSAHLKVESLHAHQETHSNLHPIREIVALALQSSVDQIALKEHRLLQMCQVEAEADHLKNCGMTHHQSQHLFLIISGLLLTSLLLEQPFFSFRQWLVRRLSKQLTLRTN